MSYILTSRLISRRLFGFQFFKLGNRAATSGCVQEIKQRPGETYDDKNARLCRPLAPHLSVYKPQFTSILSIIHRITGTVGAAYIVFFSACAVHLPYDFTQVTDYIECMGPPWPLIWLARFTLAFPYVYHTCNGVRHLTWDTGNCLAMNQVFYTGMAVLTLTTILMIIVVFVL